MDSNLMGLDALPTTDPTDDLSSIAWVHEELRRSLEAAHKSLRRFLKDSEAVTGSDIDSVDPGVLRAARSQIHQGVGALELVGLPAAAIVLRASETAIKRAIGKPQSLTPELVADLEHASFGLLDYLARLLAGKHVSSLSLFPSYRAVQESVEAERVHPADLWAVDWRWRDVANDADVVPRQADVTVRAEFEGHLLSLMRSTQTLTAAAKMSEICAGLGAGSMHPQVRTFWNLAAAMFEAQHHGLLPFDVFTKRVASRLLAQFRILSRGDSDVSERLARDLLFFCAQAAPGAAAARLPRLGAARAAYGLPLQTPTDYSLSVLGRFDPAIIVHAKKRLAAVRQGQAQQPLETWMEELYRRVSDRQTMGSVVQELRASLGVAEKAIDEFFRNPTSSGVLVDVPPQLSSMRGVLSVLGMDQASQALLRMRDEVDGLVSTEVDPEKVAKAGVFDRIAGNLSALGFMIDMLSVQPQLAKSLFVFDAEKGTLAPVMGRVGPDKSAKAEPAPVEPHLIEAAQLLAFSSVREDVPLQEVTLELERLSHEAQAADQPTLAAAVLKAQEAILEAADDPIKVTTARGELSEALVDFVATATEPAGLEMISEPVPLAPMKPIALIGDLEHDDEMRDVFPEEAREVIEGPQAAC